MVSWFFMIELLLIGIAPGVNETATVRQTVDLIEMNHFVDDEGREVFRQVIFYDWSKADRRFHVRAWRLIKHENQVPQRHWNPSGHQCSWHDNGLLKQVWAPQFRETWTQRDPERANRKFLPEDQRVPLFVPKVANEHRETERR